MNRPELDRLSEMARDALQRATQPVAWSDTVEDHLRNALTAYIACERNPSTADWQRIRLLIRRAALEASRQVALLQVTPPQATCRYCGEPITTADRDGLCPECLMADLNDADGYGEPAVDLRPDRRRSEP